MIPALYHVRFRARFVEGLCCKFTKCFKEIFVDRCRSSYLPAIASLHAIVSRDSLARSPAKLGRVVSGVGRRVEARLSILDIRVSFCASFLLRYQRRHP